MITVVSFLPLWILWTILWTAATTTTLAQQQTNNTFCADVIDAQFFASPTLHATISSPYETGWEQYADEFRVTTTTAGTTGTTVLLATRPLAHPHVTEQPFTRSVALSQESLLLVDNGIVAVSARDSINGYCGKVFWLNITSNSPIILNNNNSNDDGLDNGTVTTTAAPSMSTFRPSLSPNSSPSAAVSVREQSRAILYYPCLFLTFLVMVARN